MEVPSTTYMIQQMDDMTQKRERFCSSQTKGNTNTPSDPNIILNSLQSFSKTKKTTFISMFNI